MSRRRKPPKPTLQAIRSYWHRIGPLPRPATDKAIKLAITRTRNPWGITSAGRPYWHPVAGMRIAVFCSACRLTCFGTIEKTRETPILDARQWKRPIGDPECKILLDCGRTVYHHQTSMAGYFVPAATPDAGR